jgi:glutamate 5-kinase
VREVRGTFSTGALVHILDGDETLLAAGLCQFSSEDLRRIQGKSSLQIIELLGPAVSTEVIHRDNMVLLHEKESVT